jgi:fatty-acyl-CoA synthase
MTPTPAERREELERRHPEWVERTISQQFDHAAEEFAERPFFITAERTYTYAEMRDWSRRIASGLIARGVRTGDHVAMVMGNHPEFAAVKFAIARVGAVAVPINFLLRRHELSYVLGQSNARALFIMDRLRDTDYLAELDAMIDGWEQDAGGTTLPDLANVFVLETGGPAREGATSIAALAEEGTAETDAELARREDAGDPRAHCDVVYTSGTTGRPKGSMCTHDMVVRVAYSSAYSRAIEDGRRIIFALPMYHVFGYVEGMLACTFAGGAIIPHVQFDAVRMLREAERFEASEIVGVPVMTTQLLDAAEEHGFDNSNVVQVFNSGGLSPAWIWQRIRDVLGGEGICVGYGMTETTASTTCVLPEEPNEVHRVSQGTMKLEGVAGRDVPGGRLAEYRVIDPETGEDAIPGEPGEFECRGYAITRGYYDKPEETAEAFTDDGWFRTGDVGYITAEGYLTLTGRIKESYRCGGEMVMPKELEELINEHPLVAASYVVGVPHEKMGEVGCVCIVPAGDERVAQDEIVDLCRENLARFKVPRHVIFVTPDEVPMTATGRPQKFKLLELAKQRLAEQTAPTS